jgi:predicted ATPase/DNA-binding NarL/FixJ family response regulator
MSLRRRLPLQPGPLIGRESLLNEASALLSSGAVRLLTLTGPAGAGKTRLAVAVAEAAAAAYADGAVFVDLAPVRDPAQVVAAIAGAAGVADSGGRPLPEALAAALGTQRLLLLLDNCEQVLAAAPDVGALLAACPNVTVLATSRAALHLRWEHELAVPPLGVPDLAAPLPDAAELAATPAVALFVTRAQAVRTDFALTAENARTVAEVCVRLDGLPLALELAAARTRVLAPEALLARLDRRLHLLTGGGLDRPTRHQTLRAAVGSSYDLLDAPERALFRRLSVFAGGASLEGAIAVCCGPDLADGTLLDALEALAASSLVRVEAPSGQGDVRYTMLETIREYAAERLVESGEAPERFAHHAGYCLHLAEVAAGDLRGHRQMAALARLDAAHDDLRAVLDRALPRQEEAQYAPLGFPVEPPDEPESPAVPAQGLRLAAALAPYWTVRGHLTEGQRRLEALLDAAGPDAPPDDRAAALLGAGQLARTRADWDRARAHLQEGLEVARGLGRPHLTGQIATTLGQMLYDLGDMRAGSASIEEGVALLEAAGSLEARIEACLALAALAEVRNDRRAARAALETALSGARRVGDRVAQAAALYELGRLSGVAGEPERALVLLEEGLAVAGEVGSPGERLHFHRWLGEILCRLGDHRAAERHLQASLDLAREIDSAKSVAYGTAALGVVVLRAGDVPRATVLLEAALAQAEALGHPWVRGKALGGLTTAVALAGDHKRALALLHQLILLYRDLDDQAAVAGALDSLADMVTAGHVPGPASASPVSALRRAAAALRRRGGAVPAHADDLPAGDELADGAEVERTVAEALALTAPDASGRGRDARPPGPRPFDLTERESEVLGLLVRGASDAEIARQLVISVRTANRHVSNILSKTGAPNRTAAAAIALGQDIQMN